MFISERVIFSQKASVISANKNKIFTSDLYYKDCDKLEMYLVQIKLYVKRHNQ